MRKPEVTISNYQTVYEYYSQYKQPKVGAWLGHTIMSWAFRPEVEYATGSEELIESVTRDKAIRSVIAFNHLSGNDQYAVSAMAIREPAFKSLVGNTFVQSKEPLFHHPNKILRPVLRRGVDIMGAIPTFRKKDVDDDQSDLRRLATAKLIETSVNKLRDGRHMAIFPEGTRNTVQPEIVQPLRSGITSVVGEVATTHQVAVIPIGFTYETDKHHPHMYVESPALYDDIGDSEFLPWLQSSLQIAVDKARFSALNAVKNNQIS